MKIAGKTIAGIGAAIAIAGNQEVYTGAYARHAGKALIAQLMPVEFTLLLLMRFIREKLLKR